MIGRPKLGPGSLAAKIGLATALGVPHTHIQYSIERDAWCWTEVQRSLFDDPFLHVVADPYVEILGY